MRRVRVRPPIKSFRVGLSFGFDQGSVGFKPDGNPCTHLGLCERCVAPARLWVDLEATEQRTWRIAICNRAASLRYPPKRVPGIHVGVRRLRRVFGPTWRPGHYRPLFRESRIYVDPTLPSEDLLAQISLVFLQAELVGEPTRSDIATWFADDYLAGFRIRAVKDPSEKREIRMRVLESLRLNWSTPEHWRGWRQYIKRTLLGRARDDTRAGRNHLSAVHEMADHLDVSRRTVYRLLERNLLRREGENLQITETGTLHFEQAQRRRREIAERRQLGATIASARKEEYRARKRRGGLVRSYGARRRRPRITRTRR